MSVLRISYDLGHAGCLQRLGPELSEAFGAAFAAAEADLRQWMPSAARDQEDPVAFVGWCVTPAEHHAVIAYWLHPAWRGRGIVPSAVRAVSDAAFEAMPAIDRIHAHLDAANTPSERVLTKAGFEHRDTFTRPPHTASESDTEWLFVRCR